MKIIFLWNTEIYEKSISELEKLFERIHKNTRKYHQIWKNIYLRIPKNTRKCNINAHGISPESLEYAGDHIWQYTTVFTRIFCTFAREKTDITYSCSPYTRIYMTYVIASFSQLVIYHELGVINFDLSFFFFTVGR